MTNLIKFQRTCYGHIAVLRNDMIVVSEPRRDQSESIVDPVVQVFVYHIGSFGKGSAFHMHCQECFLIDEMKVQVRGKLCTFLLKAPLSPFWDIVFVICAQVVR